MIIDVHEHLPGEAGYLDKLLRAMDEAGIDKSCLSPLPPHFEGPGDDAVLKAAKSHPDRIVPFAYLRLGKDKPESLDELKDQGFKGLKTHVPPANYDDKAFHPLYAKAEDLGFPILFHTGIIVVRTENDKRFDVNSSRMRPIYLDGVARAFPTLNMIAAHLGFPWHEEAAAVTQINPNVFVDLALGKGDHFQEYDVAFFRRIFHWKNAWRKVVFGGSAISHSGWILQKRYLDIMDKLDLDADTRSAVLGATVARITGTAG